MVKNFLPKIPILKVVIAIIVISSLTLSGYFFYTNSQAQKKRVEVEQMNIMANSEIATLSTEITNLKTTIQELENEDQRKTNNELKVTIAQIKAVYNKSVAVYEDLIDLKAIDKNTAKFDDAYAKFVTTLASTDYKTADTELTKLSGDISTQKAKVVAASIPLPAAAPVSNSPPASGFARQTVKTDIGDYVVSLVSADLGSTRVIVDTASDGDCGNNCPVLPLATYVSRNGAYAGINGSYFCPASYPSCAGKTNSFDLLVMNKNKKYFNSDNNVYSNNPAVIFGGGYIRFVSAASQWGRDTGIDSMLSNYPLTVQGGNISFGGNSDPKQGSKGNRSFVGNKGNTVYIGVVYNVSVAESAYVLKALGLENALNLDSGGSTALWSGGYKAGPGRDIPNAILFVKK